MNVRIEIETKTFVRFWLVVIAFALLGLILYLARTAFVIIFIAGFLALALNAPVSLIARKLPSKSRGLATAIAYTIVAVVLGAILFLAVPPIFQETNKFIQNLPETVSKATSRYRGINIFIEKYNLRPKINEALDQLVNTASKWSNQIGQITINSVGSFMSFMANAFMVFILVFLILVEGPYWLKKIWGLYRDRRIMEKHKRIVRRMRNVFNSYVVGQLTVSSICAVCAGLTVFVLTKIFSSVPGNLCIPIAATTLIFSLVPMFGAAIAGTISAVLISFNSIFAAIIYVVFFITYQQIENNIIMPSIQSKRLELSPLISLIAVTFGLYLFGILGGIISVPIAGCIRVLIDEKMSESKFSRNKTAISKIIEKATKPDIVISTVNTKK